MTSTTPKPRAGELVPETVDEYLTSDWGILRAVEELIVERDALAAQLETCKAAHMSNCLDADKLRTLVRSFREALEDIVERDCAYGNSYGDRTVRECASIARSALAKHGR